MTSNLTIPAAINGNPGAISLNISEAGFSVVSASGSFTLQIGNGQAMQNCTANQSYGAPVGAAMGSVQFSNPTSTAVNLVIGPYGAVQSNAVTADVGSVVGSNTSSYDFGVTPNPNGITFPGVDGSGRSRKIIYITNYGFVSTGGSSSTAFIAVLVGSALVAAVYPQTTLALQTNAQLILTSANQNLSGSPAHLLGGVLEVFQAKAIQTST